MSQVAALPCSSTCMHVVLNGAERSVTLPQVLATLAALAAKNDMASLDACAAGLAAATLADVVIAKLVHLPPREAWAGADVPPAAGAGALAGLMQVCKLCHLAFACRPVHPCRVVNALSCPMLLHAAWLRKHVWQRGL